MPKRGRPTKRNLIQTSIVDALMAYNTPANSSAIRRDISKKLGQNISWNTIQKYLNELVQIEKVQKISTVHSKTEGKEGLTLYQIKK